MSIEIYLPKPHEGQIAAWTAAIEERFHAVCCGRRWGKTVMLVNIATSFATRKFAVPTTGQLIAGTGRDCNAGHYISTQRPACKMHEPYRRYARSGGADMGILPRRSHGVRHVWCAGNTGLL